MGRILDLAALPGIYAGRLLAESGHEVMRVELPEGDTIRRMGPYLGNQPGVERGAFHQFFNAGKRSLTLDTSSAEGRDVFDRLVATADAIIFGPMPTSPDPLGGSDVAPTQEPPRPLAGGEGRGEGVPASLDPAQLHANHPGLVVAVIEGDDEPELSRYARSGLLALTGHPGQTPMLMGGHVVYAATGLYVAVATAAALLVQDLTGEGQLVTVRLQECMESFIEQAVATYAASGKRTERRGYRGAITAVSGAMPSADGFWMVSVSHTAERWATLMDWMQDPVLMADTSLLDEANRGPKKDMILDRMETWSRALKKVEAVEGAQQRHIPAAPISTPMDLAEDPQLIARGFLTEVDHPDVGSILYPKGAIAALMGKEVALAPRLGQHTAEILTEIGYDPAHQTALFERGVV